MTISLKLLNISSDDEPCGNPQVTLDQESPDEEDMVVVHKVAPEPEVNLKINKTRQPSPPDSSEDEESEDDGYKPIEIMYVFNVHVHVLCVRVVCTSCVYVLCTRVMYTCCVHVLCTRVMYTCYVHVLCTRVMYTCCVHVLCVRSVQISLTLKKTLFCPLVA